MELLNNLMLGHKKFPNTFEREAMNNFQCDWIFKN